MRKSPDMSWKDAAAAVLDQAQGALHYTDIADSIVSQGLRQAVGATPATSVNVAINSEIRSEGDQAIFVKVNSGQYILRKHLAVSAEENPPTELEVKAVSTSVLPEKAITSDSAVIEAFGMSWRRGLVVWNQTPKLLGQQSRGSTPVDFADQRGVYLLHDGRAVIYVGRAIDQPLGKRIGQHTTDRLNGRWDRFSWFGLLPVTENGSLIDKQIIRQLPFDIMVAALEAILIESLEPPQNRKRGDAFEAVEYLQVEDPKIRELQKRELLRELEGKLLGS